ncbi:MAG: hypothetical protein A2W94_07435 [Bacteroidetes bacterium GWE2_42_42]|nr:MAG: hypothetical protein A2W94_07435 [Bacteroidetes bacterium GWE2_42_42]
MGNLGWGQCTNTSPYITTNAPTSGTVIITTVQYESEYNTINSVAASTVYISEINNTGDYITVRQGSFDGPLIAFGATPLTWTSTTAGTYFIHYNTNSSCGTASVNRTTTLTYVGPACSATIAIGSNSVAASNICAGTTKVPLQSFSLAVAAGCNGNLTNVGFTTTGTYVQADISKYQLWYNTSNSLAGATQLGPDLASSGGAAARTFSAFTSPTLTAGSTYYFWITADIASGAGNGNTIAINAIATGNLTSTSTKAGSTTAGGTQTIIAAPTTATNSSTQSICGGSATLAGNSPTIGNGTWSVFSGPSTLSTQFANTSVYNTTFTPTGGDGNYVVRWTISNSCSSTSADATVTVSSVAPSCATQTSPANGATGQLVPGVTLTWNAVSGASGYDVFLQAGTNPPTTLESSNQAGTSYSTGPLNPSTTYYWYVVPRNICGAASGCSASAFSFITGTCTSDIYVTATAGTLTGSYTTLKGAFDKINDGTHQGVITISVGRNTTETATALLNRSTGTAPYSSVLIQPCGGSYTISGSLSGVPVINLNGADNVAIDGINSGGNMLAIANSSATAGSSAIQFINDATSNIVRNCNIYSSNISTSSGTIVFSTTIYTTGNDNNTIEYCSIYNGTTAPYVGIYSSGTTTSNAHYNSNNTISNCNIYNFINPTGNDGYDTPPDVWPHEFTPGTDFGIRLIDGTTAWTISNNSLYRTNTTTSYNHTNSATHYGIFISNTSGGGFTVSGNYIGGAAAMNGGSSWGLGPTTKNSNFRGIHVNTSATLASNISSNVVDNITFTTSAGGTSQDCVFAGIMLKGLHIANSNIIGTETKGISVTGTAGYSDINGIYYFDESASVPATFTSNDNIIGKITNTNTGGNASFYGIRAYSYTHAMNWTCTNNIVGGAAANSITCTGTSGNWVHGIFFSWGTSANVTGNTIRNITNDEGSMNGIKAQPDNLSGITATYLISGNTIHNLTLTSGTNYGILLNGNRSTNNVLEKNKIYSLTGTTAYGICQENNYGGFSDVIRNNMIAINNGIATSTTVGIRYNASTTGNCNIYHNSVYLHGSSTIAYCIEKYSAATSCNVKNNIFFNACSGSSRASLNYYNQTGLTSNCNDLYAPACSTGYVNPTGYGTLASWQGTGHDLNSVCINPGFISLTAPYDLHVAAGIQIFSCLGLATDDFDSEGRLVPHMGADEAPTTLLPVSLLGFAAICANEEVNLEWSTATETNNNYFTLERSSDMNEWTLVGKVVGAGNSNSILNYSFTDKEQYRGMAYYRLTQTDYNGESETFEPVAVRCNEINSDISCYPNPFTDQLVVTLQNIGAEQGSLVLRDVTGRVIMYRELSSDDFSQQSVALKLSGIASGVYSLEFRSGSIVKTVRVVKNK